MSIKLKNRSERNFLFRAKLWKPDTSYARRKDTANTYNIPEDKFEYIEITCKT